MAAKRAQLLLGALLLIPLAQASHAWAISTLDPQACRPVIGFSASRMLKDHSSTILEIGKLYGVEPVAIASILALEIDERTGADDAQDDLLKLGLPPADFSYGPAQIKLRTAIAAEAYVAGLEKRKPRSQDQLISELKTPAGSIRLVGAILKQIQDEYPRYAHGVDISKRPEILGTIYNIGLNKAAENRIESGGNEAPRPNAYGKKIAARRTFVDFFVVQPCNCKPSPWSNTFQSGNSILNSLCSSHITPSPRKPAGKPGHR